MVKVNIMSSRLVPCFWFVFRPRIQKVLHRIEFYKRRGWGEKEGHRVAGMVICGDWKDPLIEENAPNSN